jgi:hypothetical protein
MWHKQPRNPLMDSNSGCREGNVAIQSSTPYSVGMTNAEGIGKGMGGGGEGGGGPEWAGTLCATCKTHAEDLVWWYSQYRWYEL